MEGAGAAPRRSPSPHPQIQPSEDGAGVTCRRSPCLHPQNQPSDDGARATRRRRSHGASPSTPGSPPLNDDLLREILVRLPPQPSSLPRASAVCRRWRGLVADPRFLHSFRVHHRRPPLLGFFANRDGGIVFSPVLDPPDRIPPARFSLGRGGSSIVDNHVLDDCRHGLVLLKSRLLRAEVVVCDPVTGEQRRLAVPPEFRACFFKGAVLCAAGADNGHVHGGCHSSPFKVVLMSMYKDVNRPTACVYSSETGIWGDIISTEAPYRLGGHVSNSATLVGNALYWLSRRGAIVEFDLDGQRLAVVTGPPVTNDIFCQNHWRMAPLASLYCLFLASKCGQGMLMLMVLPRGRCGRQLKCIQFSASLLRLMWGGNASWGMVRIVMLYFCLWATLSTWFNLSRCSPQSFMKPSIPLDVILLRVSVHQEQQLMVDLMELKCCMIHRMIS